MIVAAGVLVLAPDPRTGADTALMLLRSGGSDHPWEWVTPGGRVEAGETVAEAAARECEEECGLAVEPGKLGEPWTRCISDSVAAPCTCCGTSPCVCAPGCAGCSCATAPVQTEDVDFTTYLCRVKAQFEPQLCDEHVAWCWAPVNHAPGPTHPGALTALGRLAWNELDIARAIADGRLMSPVRYENVWLFAIRITGTGAAYRAGLKEYVWREPAQYLNDEFLARCNGLQVIWVHPPKATLDSGEFAKRTIGAIFLPYIKGDDVWGIAKVYDDEAAAEMIAGQVSTSPTVVFGRESGNARLTTEGGERILIEGVPRLLDHVAICAAGVWDKGLAPAGVDREGALQPVTDGAQVGGGSVTIKELLADAVAGLSTTDLRGRLLGLRARNLNA